MTARPAAPLARRARDGGGTGALRRRREAWVDYKGTPLRWHVPSGVLFDLLADETVRRRPRPGGKFLFPRAGPETVHRADHDASH